jgi:hypothetical protein
MAFTHYEVSIHACNVLWSCALPSLKSPTKLSPAHFVCILTRGLDIIAHIELDLEITDFHDNARAFFRF